MNSSTPFQVPANEYDNELPHEWDSYFCTVDDKFASIRLNLGLAPLAPLAQLPVCGLVDVYLQLPSDKGISRNEETETLYAIEDALQEILAQEEYALFTGCCTADGVRHFYFYAASQDGWESRVAQAMTKFPEYKYIAAAHPDEDWNCYFDFLYPTPADQHIMNNRKLCEILLEHGCDLEKPRLIDHSFALLDESQAAPLMAKLKELGFTGERIVPSEQLHLDETPDGTAGIRVEASRNDKPNDMDSVTLALLDLEEHYDAVYAGWGTSIDEAIQEEQP